MAYRKKKSDRQLMPVGKRLRAEKSPSLLAGAAVTYEQVVEPRLVLPVAQEDVPLDTPVAAERRAVPVLSDALCAVGIAALVPILFALNAITIQTAVPIIALYSAVVIAFVLFREARSENRGPIARIALYLAGFMLMTEWILVLQLLLAR